MSEYASRSEGANPFLDPVVYFRVTAWALGLVALLGIILFAMEDKPARQALSMDSAFLQFTFSHNILHILLAAACFLFGYAALDAKLVRTFAIVFGGVYLLLGVVGFFVWNTPDDPWFAFTPTLNIVHILLGGWGLVTGLLSKP